ncbi:MAG: HlyC/CorC family transporter [Chloroflexi bacterium]|nr:MAG: HlyC/CorC family transporter [Chloroflexota bacterium]
MSSLLLIFAVIAFLIAVNGLYVAAEFSAVSARRPRLAQLADAGNSSARIILDTISDPHKLDVYIAACQVGITLSSLLLGFYAQNQIIGWAAPFFDLFPAGVRTVVQPAVSVSILLGLTILQVILGELIPKNIGIQFPERLVLWTAAPMRWSLAFFRPLIWLFNGSGRLILRLFGVRAVAEHAHVHSPEEIVLLVEESSAGGVLDREERRLLVNTLQLRKQTVRKVMVPRSQMLAAEVDMPVEDLFRLLAGSVYSRLPLYEDSVDKIVGLVHLKDLLQLRYWQRHPAAAAGQPQEVRQVMHPALFVPDSIPIEEVIAQMQATHQNIAIVVDEYGGTAGLVTFEDLMEEIIGDFQDEFDPENPVLRLIGKNQLVARGDVQLEDLSHLLGIHFVAPEVDTIGGLVTKALGKIPTVGEKVEVHGVRIRVEKMDGHRVAEVHLQLTPEQFVQLKEMTHE